MLVTVTCTINDAVYPLQVSPDTELETLKELIKIESQFTNMDIVVFHNGKILMGNNRTLNELGIGDNEVLLFGPAPQGSIQNVSTPPRLGQPVSRAQNTGVASGIDWSSVQLPGASMQQQSSQRQRTDQDNPENIRQMLLNSPHQFSLLKERNPQLAEAIHNPATFHQLLEQQRKERFEQERQRIRLLTADPFDQEAQRQIAEEIRMENVNQNMHTAMEYNPEAFAEVYMLYINCKVNGFHIKAFVDSGAQMTIMSKSCAERCNITRLIDNRWQGMAVGVGQQKIIGRVHMAPMQIENDYLSTSFTILENQPMDILFGLDMLKRHQCCIDLKENALVIGTTGTKTKFLSESELPECARLNRKRTLPSAGSSSATSQEEEDKQLAEALEKSTNDV